MVFNPSPDPVLSSPNEASLENHILFYIHSDTWLTSVPS